MRQQLENIRAAAAAALEAAASAEDLEALRVQYLGKKGELTAVLKQMGKLAAEERPVMGQLANELRAKLEAAIEKRAGELAGKAMAMRLLSETVDVTVPGETRKLGKQHLIHRVLLAELSRLARDGHVHGLGQQAHRHRLARELSGALFDGGFQLGAQLVGELAHDGALLRGELAHLL